MPKKFISTILLLLPSPAAYSGAGWTDKGVISEIQATASGKLIIRGVLEGNESGCKNSAAYYVDYTSNGADEIYSLLLQSIATKNQVKLYVTGKCELNGMSEISAASIFAK